MTAMLLNCDLYVKTEIEVERLVIDGLDYWYISEKYEDTRETDVYPCIEMAIEEMRAEHGCLLFETTSEIYVYKKSVPYMADQYL